MSAGPKATSIRPVAIERMSAVSETSLMTRFSSRQSNEIVIAFAGPIGCGIKSTISSVMRSLKKLGYQGVEVVKLSRFLEDSITDGRIKPAPQEAGSSNQFYRYRKLQEAGKDLRRLSSNKHILAEYAVERIVVLREKYSPASDDAGAADPVPARVAYLIDQVKRPEEVELLRALYRNLFYLVGVTKPYQQRTKLLEDEGVDETETPKLIEIDRNEEGDTGQQLDRTLHLADFFVRNDAGVDQRGAIDRFIRLIHGDKSQTPDRIELGMYAAYAAGLRSACLSRQVGAAIASAAGEILATGCNDVPAPGGGLYTSGSGKPDYRCVHKPDKKCFNDFHKRDLQQDIGRAINSALTKSSGGEALDVATMTEVLGAIYRDTRVGSLIEFSRSVHAEMDALISVARAGGPSVRDATLYSTTFPCHSCARHIVAAGISEVYHIEPYEKSMAQLLHDDAIVFEFPSSSGGTPDAQSSAGGIDNGKMVKFLHFEGVSPRLFAVLFRAESRKDKATGTFIPMGVESPNKVLPEYLDNYKDFERKAVQHFQADLAKVPFNTL